MPRGDREKLKADIKDGYTKISNLLLEALSMANLSGVQKGICLFIIRRTYAWGQKSDRISLQEYAEACNSDRTYISKQLKELIKKNIILRLNASYGQIPEFSINTRVAQWDKGCLNVQQLSKRTMQGLFKCSTQGLSKQTTVEQPQPSNDAGFRSPKESIKENIKDTPIQSSGSNIVPTSNPPQENNIHINLETVLGRKLQVKELETVNSWFGDVEQEAILYAFELAAIQDAISVAYIDEIIFNWVKEGITTKAQAEEREKNFQDRKRGHKKGGHTNAASGRASPGQNTTNSAGNEEFKSRYDGLSTKVSVMPGS